MGTGSNTKQCRLSKKVRRTAVRLSRNKEKAYLKVKFEELATNSMVKNIREMYRGINDFQKG